jgi:hypothetical protein
VKTTGWGGVRSCEREDVEGLEEGEGGSVRAATATRKERSKNQPSSWRSEGSDRSARG